MSMRLTPRRSHPHYDDPTSTVQINPLGFKEWQWRIDDIVHCLAKPASQFVDSRQRTWSCSAMGMVCGFLYTDEYYAANRVRKSDDLLGDPISRKLTKVAGSTPIIRPAGPGRKIGLQFQLKPFADFIATDLFDVGTGDSVEWIAENVHWRRGL
jgi:hypothetical protein